MTESEGVRALTCPSCGAQIHAAEGQAQTTCEYCGALLELPHPSQPEAIVTILTPPPSAPPVRPVSRGVRPARAGILLIVLAGMACIAAGGIGLVVYQSRGAVDLSSIKSALSSLNAATPAMLIPAGDGQSTDVLIHTYDSSKDTQFLSYIDGSTHTLRWQTDPLGENSYRVAMANGRDTIFVADQTEIMALDRETGQVAWRASISDELPASCTPGCMKLVGARVVALAKDGELYGLDAQTGRTVWNVRLDSTPDRVYATGDRVAVFDRRDGNVVLLVIDPVNGSVVQALSPECTGDSSGMTDDPDLSSPILVPPDQKSMIIAYGFFNACVQRWNLETGTMMWDASLGDISFSFAFGPEPILIGDTIFVASDNQIVSVGMADGSWKVLLEDPDYEFVPLAEQGGTLITRAKRTRGSTRFELWGVDEASGSRVWQHPFPGGEPLDEPDSMSGLVDKGDLGWTAHLTPAGLIVVQATADPHQLTVQVLDPRTGAGGGEQSIPLIGITGDFYSVPDILGWPRNQLWLIIDGQVDVINLTEPGLEFVWP